MPVLGSVHVGSTSAKNCGIYFFTYAVGVSEPLLMSHVGFAFAKNCYCSLPRVSGCVPYPSHHAASFSPFLSACLFAWSPREQAKKIVENALLSKLQEAQRQAEETQAALALSEERVAGLETERARQGAAVSALTKQLQDANR